jgi:hypothetical protein
VPLPHISTFNSREADTQRSRPLELGRSNQKV